MFYLPLAAHVIRCSAFTSCGHNSACSPKTCTAADMPPHKLWQSQQLTRSVARYSINLVSAGEQHRRHFKRGGFSVVGLDGMDTTVQGHM
jgi:hypothetical protein